MVEVPRSILRGSGFSAYHVYEVKVSMFHNRDVQKHIVLCYTFIACWCMPMILD